MKSIIGLSTSFSEYKNHKAKDFIFLILELLYCAFGLLVSIIGLFAHNDFDVLGGIIILLIILYVDLVIRINNSEDKE